MSSDHTSNTPDKQTTLFIEGGYIDASVKKPYQRKRKISGVVSLYRYWAGILVGQKSKLPLNF